MGPSRPSSILIVKLSPDVVLVPPIKVVMMSFSLQPVERIWNRRSALLIGGEQLLGLHLSGSLVFFLAQRWEDMKPSNTQPSNVKPKK